MLRQNWDGTVAMTGEAMSEAKTRVVLAWSGGKDSLAALQRLRRDGRVEVAGLLTTLNRRYDRISMHGVRRLLLEAQAEALGLPVMHVWTPHHSTNEAYEAAMGRALARLRAQGVQAVAFGDLFLEDIRAYRERMLAPTGLQPLFPIWGEDTGTLAREMIEWGMHATLVCVDPQALEPSFVGRPYDLALLADLPEKVDPCGENGEFHTFVHDGPGFRHPVPAVLGVRMERQGFWFADLLPVAAKPWKRTEGVAGGAAPG